jgi:hypothetical protein
MTIQIHGIDHLTIEALPALPDVTAEAMALGVPGDNRWDHAAPVRYPSRAAFIDMMTSPDYERANAERENGCAAHSIIAIRETYNKLAPTKE